MPRAGLSRAVVVAEAARTADEVGWDRLTLAAVADRLGVRLPSLYKHVDGLDGLRRDLALLALGEFTAALQAGAVGRSGRDALVGMADAYRAWAAEHPGRYVATLRAPDPLDDERVAASNAALGVVTQVLAGYGLGEDDRIDAARSLRATLHGFVSLEAAGGFGLPQSVTRSFHRLVEGLDATLITWGTGVSV